MNAIASPGDPPRKMALALQELTESGLDLRAWNDLSPEDCAKFQLAFASDRQPDYLVSPHTPEALAEVISLCDRNSWSVLPCGSGSKLSWGGLLSGETSLIVSTQRLNRIVEHAVGDLTVTVEAGVKLADLQALLQQTGQFLPLTPAYGESTTVGGLVATGDSWRQRYGGVRDMVLGISFVRADGQIAKAGGRVVKNVAGYDLMKLFAGSYGTLGILSQVTFRTYPLPEASGSMILVGAKGEIAQAIQGIIASNLTPSVADILSPAVVRQLGVGEGMGIAIRCQSIAESVREQIAQIESLGKQLGLQPHLYRETDETKLWHQLQQLLWVPTSPKTITCKIGVMPTAAVDFLDRLDRSTAQQGLGMIHASTGLGRLNLSCGRDRLLKLRQECQECQGFLTVLEASPTLKQSLDPWGYPGNALDLMGKLKSQFDPKNILSPGRFVGGI